MIDAGELNKRVELFEATQVRGNMGWTQELVSKGKVWAKVDYLSDRERFAAAQVQSKAILRIIIRKRGITHDWKIDYRGKRYDVESIKPVGRDEAFLELTVGEV